VIRTTAAERKKVVELANGGCSLARVALCLSAPLATNLLRQTNTAKFHLACAHLKIKRGALSVSAWVPGAVPLHFQNKYKIQSAWWKAQVRSGGRRVTGARALAKCITKDDTLNCTRPARAQSHQCVMMERCARVTHMQLPNYAARASLST
jgi:hypothetical protein